MSSIIVGDLVTGTGISSGTKYEGIVLSQASPGFNTRIKVTKVKEVVGNRLSAPSYANIINVKKVEENMSYVSNLVGPKPEPVQEPKHPTPWSASGRDIIDANGNRVLRIQFASAPDTRQDHLIPMAEAYELARVIKDSVNALHGKVVKDSPSPF